MNGTVYIIMMSKKLLLYTIAGILFTSVSGTLAHFVYDWSGQNILAGFFTPVNESTWEHMKLLFFPMLLYGIFTIPYLKQDFPCILCAYPVGILASTFAIPTLFYTYSGILGTNYTAIDILIFYISVIFAFAVVYLKTKSCESGDARTGEKLFLPWLAILLLAACFIIFTIIPPSLGIFQVG